MSKYFLIIFSFILFSCKKEGYNEQGKSIASELYNKAKVFRDSNVSDSAFTYYNLAKNSYLESYDSIGAGKALVNMAILQEGKSDYYGSIETSVEANRYLENKKDSISKQTLASNFNNMAICSSYLYNFDDAISYYKDAIKYSNDTENKYMYYNNLGAVLITIGEYKEAQKNIKLALNTKDSLKYAKIINNWARAKYYDNPNYDPLPEFYTALKIRIKNNHPVEENSSYATLSTYFLPLDRKEALNYAKKMLNTSLKSNSPEDQLQALQKLINLDNKNYLEYFGRFQKLNDSVQIARSKAKNQFAVVRYDVEQKNAQNQKLIAKNLQKNIGLIALGLALIGGFFWYKKRKKRLQQENELKIKESQLKMSKKVHDKVANKVYHVMSEVENTSDMDRDILLDKLESIYHISRDISYEDKDLVLENSFSQQLSQMLKSYASETVMIPTIGNEESLWNDVPDKSKIEIFYILQELMTNMRKHSQASRVIINFERENNLIHIVYSDNGVGIKLLSPKNGLGNTETRINSIDGTINFDTKTEKGLKITLSFPVKN